MAQKTPYTNYHDLNLDWIVKKIKSAINTAYNPENPPPYPVTSVNGYAGAVQLDSTEIPYINGQPETVWDEVHKRYVKPASGIPAHDLADTYIESPAVAGNAGQVLTSDGHGSQSWQTPVAPDSIIDDNAGYGDTDKTWSADKLTQIEGDIIDLQNDKLDAPYSPGSAGQVLTADGNGSQTWEDIPPVVLDVSINTPASVMSFPDGADGMPMAVEAEIAPVQDLHGYDNPWPAGGGKNLCEGIENGAIDQTTGENINSLNVYRTINHIPVTPSGNISVSGFITTGNIRIFRYGSDKSYLGNSYTVGLASDKTKTIAIDANTYFIRFQANESLMTNESLIQAEAGSTVTSYAPYGNICPISGWTGANVTVSPTSDPADPDKEVYQITFPDSAGPVYGGTLTVNKDGTGRMTETEEYVRIKDQAVDIIGQSTSVPGLYFARFITSEFSSYDDNANVIACNELRIVPMAEQVQAGLTGIRFNNTNHQLYVYGSFCTDASALAQFLTDNPLYVVLKKKTPVVYNLSALEVIETLKGINNIYADTGDILSLDYSADIKLYIDNLFNSIIPAEGEGF